MVFNSIEQFEEYVMKKCKNAVTNTQKEVREDVRNLAQNFYDDYYPPIMYERTEQLTSNKFIQMSPVNLFGKICEADVHLEPNSLSYDTGKKPSGEQVVSAAVSGGHGATGLKVVYGGGAKLWEKDILQSKANKDLVQQLRAQGIPM